MSLKRGIRLLSRKSETQRVFNFSITQTVPQKLNRNISIFLTAISRKPPSFLLTKRK